MKKKLSFVLAFAMVLSLAACGGSGDTTTTTASSAAPAADNAETTTTAAAADDSAEADTEASEEEKPPVEAEPVPDGALLHFDFETADGLTAKRQVADLGTLTGANFGIADSIHDILIAEGQGAVGNALYLDGKYGVDFDMPELANDTYTISFWYNADRVSAYGPIVQMGRNCGMSNADATVTWLNFTKTEWGANNADIFPVAWNRNSSIGTEVSENGVWPWIYAMDDSVHGKREWCNVTVVADGNRYVADDGMERIATKFYIDGELKWEANAENMYYQGLSPEIFKGDGLEGHIGINYWDTVFKGFIDELYIYDTALTDGQVKGLFELGNPPETPVAPEYEAPEEDGGSPAEAPAALAAAPVDASAIAALGTPERVLGWWSDHTDGYELADGATLKMKLNNYSDGAENYHNFILAFTNTAVKADLIPGADNYEGYAEYGVLRPDVWGWGAPDQPYENTFEKSWEDTQWADWLALMTDADVDISITRNGGEVTIDYVFTGADGTVMTEKAVFTSYMTADSPVFVHVGGEGAYIELLSVE